MSLRIRESSCTTHEGLDFAHLEGEKREMERIWCSDHAFIFDRLEDRLLPAATNVQPFNAVLPTAAIVVSEHQQKITNKPIP